MQKKSRRESKEGGAAGFTLVELIIVLVISAVLGFNVIHMFTAPIAKLKSAVFTMRGDFNLARSEAVTRNSDDVLVEFVFDSGANAQDGYIICVDDNDNNSCEPSDTEIKEVLLTSEVQFYDTTGGSITNGPTSTSEGDSLVSSNGITFTTNYFNMQSDGTSDIAGAVVLYVPGSPATEMRAGPFEVKVATTGKVTAMRWRYDSWSTK